EKRQLTLAKCGNFGQGWLCVRSPRSYRARGPTHRPFADQYRPLLRFCAFPGDSPMALERSDVEKIAHLARLGLGESEIPQTTETLNNILGLIDAMQAVNTDGIEPDRKSTRLNSSHVKISYA